MQYCQGAIFLGGVGLHGVALALAVSWGEDQRQGQRVQLGLFLGGLVGTVTRDVLGGGVERGAGAVVGRDRTYFGLGSVVAITHNHA